MRKSTVLWLVGTIVAAFFCSIAFSVPNQYILEYSDELDNWISVQHHTDFNAIDDGTDDTWTFEAWIHPRSHGRIFDKGCFSFYIRPAAALRFSNNIGGNATTADAAISWNEWSHVAVVKNVGSNLLFYVNGVQFGPAIACPTLALSTDSLVLGNNFFANRGFDGFIDEFRISNIARDPGTYITTGVTSAPLGADDNTIAYWNCDEGTGTTLISQQGSGFAQHNGSFGFVHGGYEPTYRAWNYTDYLPLPAELTAFYAENGDGHVILHWVTESETENAGFFIYRSMNREEGFQRINGSLIPSAGNSEGVQRYSYEDTNVLNGIPYYYKISDEDINGYETIHNFLAVGIPGVDLEGMTVEEAIINGQLAQYRLDQNYPNPFNPSTNISFLVLDDGKVELNLYNVRGEKVRTLIDGDLYQAGTYDISVNMSGLASGVYYYELKGDRGFRTVKKMLFVR